MTSTRIKLISDLGKAMLKTDSFRIGSFPTNDGKVSPYYIDLRHVFDNPQAFALVESCFEKMIKEVIKQESFDVLCAIPLTGFVLAAPLSLRFQKQLLHSSKEHPGRIFGAIRPGSVILVLDGVSETGASITNAVKALRASGGIVNQALTLIDRLEIAKQELSRIDVELQSFTTTRELASVLNERMALTEDQERVIDAKPQKI